MHWLLVLLSIVLGWILGVVVAFPLWAWCCGSQTADLERQAWLLVCLVDAVENGRPTDRIVELAKGAME